MQTRVAATILVLIVSITMLASTQELNASTTVTIRSSNSDSYIESSTPSTNYGTSTRLRVDPKSVSIKHTLVSFDLSAVPAGQVIVLAVLSLHLSTPPSASRVLEVHQVKANWTETGVTWNNQPSFLSTPTAISATGIVVIWLNWTVTADVSLGYVNPSQWFGFTVRDSQEPIQSGGFLLDFNSRESAATLRPELSVTYALQIPEMPVWAALILGAGGVVLVWRWISKRSVIVRVARSST